MDANEILEKIIGLDEQIMKLQDSFDEVPEGDRATALTGRYGKLLSATGKEDSIPIEIIRVAEMICTLENSAALLAEGLSHSNEDIRHLCGDALISIGSEDGIGAIVPAVDYALEKKDVSANEMPFILGWIEDPGGAAQMHRFLELDDPEIVYAAIEACAHAGDLESIEPLKKLMDDEREIEVEEEDDQPVTIGMLAREAVELIASIEE
jgi:HEAT repeat protein